MRHMKQRRRVQVRASASATPTGVATTATSADGSCPRRWSSRSPHSSGRTSKLRSDPDFGELFRPCCATTSAGRRPCSRRAPVCGDGPARAPQARGPRTHGRAQDQQRARSGPARPSHGQAAHRRRDGRRAARRGDCHGLRAAWPRLRRLHGHGGHGPPGPQRLPHAVAGRARRRGRRGQPHAEGRHQRGHARLGGQRARTRTICLGRCSARIHTR